MAELGFLGVVVYTLMHTPLLCGQECRAADLLLEATWALPFRINCSMVGMYNLFCQHFWKIGTAKLQINS
jgi:hypothetical protein